MTKIADPDDNARQRLVKVQRMSDTDKDGIPR